MLYIIYTVEQGGAAGPYVAIEKQWHLGEPFPVSPPEAVRVVTFRADGDELDIILTALQTHSRKNPQSDAKIATVLGDGGSVAWILDEPSPPPSPSERKDT